MIFKTQAEKEMPASACTALRSIDSSKLMIVGLQNCQHSYQSDAQMPLYPSLQEWVIPKGVAVFPQDGGHDAPAIRLHSAFFVA